MCVHIHCLITGLDESLFLSSCVWLCIYCVTWSHCYCVCHTPTTTTWILDKQSLFESLWRVNVNILSYCQGTHFTWVWAHDWNLANISFSFFIFHSNDVMSQFCTGPKSWAIVACVELWPDLIITIDIRSIGTFRHFLSWAHKPFVKWVLKHCLIIRLIYHIFKICNFKPIPSPHWYINTYAGNDLVLLYKKTFMNKCRLGFLMPFDIIRPNSMSAYIWIMHGSTLCNGSQQVQQVIKMQPLCRIIVPSYWLNFITQCVSWSLVVKVLWSRLC